MAFSDLHYNSPALGKQMAAWAILPDVPGPWPVLYLLHGRGDDHTIWCRRTSIERYAEKWPSLMIVMPDSGRSFSCDAVNGPAYQSAFVNDLVPFIDRTFRTRADRSGRAIGGLSMGGYGAVKLALQFPELFVSAHSHSGGLNWAHSWDDTPEETARILGTQLSGGPNDLYRLAAACKNPPALRIDCGVEDFILDHSREFHAQLDKIGVVHEYAEFPLGHGWDYWDLHIPEALEFHARHLGVAPKA
jgi:S-formylglutathione hydrolase FrmB